jgi:DNA invertase Pin-like site-specific DNA recombinase
MKIATYIRVSKEELNLDNQRRQLTAYAQSQGWKIVTEYSDTATGSNGDRQGWKRMLAGAARREFDLLLVYAVDRISREGATWVFSNLARLAGYGVKFHSFAEPHLSTVGPFGDVVLAMYATFAKLERDKLIERTKAGLDRARAQGRSIGRPRVAVNASEIASLREQGLSWSQIVQATGVSMGTAQRSVANLPKKVSSPHGATTAESAAHFSA